MGGELDGKQGTPQEQAGSLDAQGQAPAQQQVDTQQAQDTGATNAQGQGAPGGQGSAPEAGDAHDEGRLAQYERHIAELESQVAEAARSKEAEARLTAEIEALKKDQANQEQIDFSLERAGAHNVKAARALLDDYEGEVAKLKEAQPWLFVETKPSTSPQQTGATGLEPACATGGGDELVHWREIAGLTDKK